MYGGSGVAVAAPDKKLCPVLYHGHHSTSLESMSNMMRRII